LTGGSSLVLLLVKKRGLRHPLQLDPLSEEQIVRWADLHYQRTGSLPRYDSGPIADAPGATWCGLDNALRRGSRGLPGGSSVARLLEKYGRKAKAPTSR
jgi:hypothetical protein